jgi:hypothetical protein
MQNSGSGEATALAGKPARGRENARERRPSRRYDDDEEESAPKKSRKATGKRSSEAAAQPAPVPTLVDHEGTDEKEAKRQRRLEQNRIAAKKAYNKRVKRQAEMESEYELLRQELEATEAEAATLATFLPPEVAAGAAAGELLQAPQSRVTDADDHDDRAAAVARPSGAKDGKETEEADETPPVVAPTSPGPANLVKPATTAGAMAPPALAGTSSKSPVAGQYRRTQSIEALTSLVGMTDA